MAYCFLNHNEKVAKKGKNQLRREKVYLGSWFQSIVGCLHCFWARDTAEMTGGYGVVML